MLHAEDPEILQYLTSELREDGKTEVRYHPLSRPDFAEEAAVLRAIALARATGVPLYIAHVSSRAGADAIRKYRGLGRSGGMAHIYGETCPHYFWFTAKRYEDENGRLFVMSPPLRSEDDVTGIWEALGEDALDVVSTDHCPFRLKDKTKDIPFYEAPNGIGSIGLLLYTVYSRGRVEGENLKPLPINRIVELLSSRPARLFGLAHRKGAIMPGYDADLVIFDPTPEWIFRSSYLPGGEDHSVYDGFKLKGRVDLVVSRGEIVARDGEVLARPGRGRFVERFIPKETEQRS
ncbi:MAG TPA: amidohydrolase family protein [Clostridia bacterium]|nr:amidohydrolase family protein [Clostridia bacterium]